MRDILLKILSLLFATSVGSAADSKQIPIIIDHPVSVPRGLVVIAPVKKYLMEERLFVHLAEKLKSAGFITVRFNWAHGTLGDPQTELERASTDLQTILKNTQAKYKIPALRTVLVSKSFSTRAGQGLLRYIKHQVLLTPNCSPTEPFAVVYSPTLSSLKVSSSIFISNEDPYCDVREIYRTLASSSQTLTLLATFGDHNFVVNAGSDSANYSYQDQVIQTVVSEIVNSQKP